MGLSLGVTAGPGMHVLKIWWLSCPEMDVGKCGPWGNSEILSAPNIYQNKVPPNIWCFIVSNLPSFFLAVQACVTSIGYPGWTFGPVHINQYTAPAYICVIGALILLVLLMVMFKENTIGIDTRKDEGNILISYAFLLPLVIILDPFHYVPKYNKTAAFLCVLFWFSVCFSITNCESVEAPFTMAVFGWSDSDAVYYNSLIMTVSTIIGFGVYTSFAVWGQRLNERISITIGLCLMLGFYILTFTWPFYAERLQQLGTVC